MNDMINRIQSLNEAAASAKMDTGTGQEVVEDIFAVCTTDPSTGEDYSIVYF